MRLQLLLPLLVLFWRRMLAQTLPQLLVPSSVTVSEGLCVTVLCEMILSSHLHTFSASWFREGADTARDKPVATDDKNRDVQEETQGRFIIHWSPWGFLRNCSLSITDVRKADSGRYFLEVFTEESLKFSYLDLPVYVNVTALTEKPDIYIPQAPKAGHPVMLNCTFPRICSQGTPLIFSWSGTALSSQNHKATSSPKISLTPMPWDHGSNITCLVTFPTANVSTKRTIQLNFSSTLQNENSWAVNFTLLRGVLMATGFLLTYGLTWLYYSWGYGRG
ncbi:sialic acid-binding Ig-like lectin 13 [Macrotis lagotis]|uniref:sialic acid-binding Ig-like lectin 13 n=1 Tax=Macrotis lagotis TaxID=92651 RepID=UPI003D692A8C